MQPSAMIHLRYFVSYRLCCKSTFEKYLVSKISCIFFIKSTSVSYKSKLSDAITLFFLEIKKLFCCQNVRRHRVNHFHSTVIFFYCFVIWHSTRVFSYFTYFSTFCFWGHSRRELLRDKYLKGREGSFYGQTCKN